MWRAFPLRPNIGADGVLIEKVAADLRIDSKIMAAKFKKMAEDNGLPSCDLQKIYNSNTAQELGFWAKLMNKEEQYHELIFNAFYGQGKNISDKQVLASLVESIGLSGKDAIEHVEKGTFKAQLESDWKLAKDLELVAAPTYIANNNRLVGAHPYQRLQKFAESNGAQRIV